MVYIIKLCVVLAIYDCGEKILCSPFVFKTTCTSQALGNFSYSLCHWTNTWTPNIPVIYTDKTRTTYVKKSSTSKQPYKDMLLVINLFISANTNIEGHAINSNFNPYVACGYFCQYRMMQKSRKMKLIHLVYRMKQKSWKWLKHWYVGTHLRVLNESHTMNTNILTGFRWFSKIFASLCFGWSSLSIGRVKALTMRNTTDSNLGKRGWQES